MAEKYQSTHTGLAVDNAVDLVNGIHAGTTPVQKASQDSGGHTFQSYYAHDLVALMDAATGIVTLVLKNGNGAPLATRTFNFASSTLWTTIREQVNELMNGQAIVGEATKAHEDEDGNNIKASYASNIRINTNTSTGVLTLQLLNKNGANLGDSVSFDLGGTDFWDQNVTKQFDHITDLIYEVVSGWVTIDSYTAAPETPKKWDFIIIGTGGKVYNGTTWLDVANYYSGSTAPSNPAYNFVTIAGCSYWLDTSKDPAVMRVYRGDEDYKVAFAKYAEYDSVGNKIIHTYANGASFEFDSGWRDLPAGLNADNIVYKGNKNTYTEILALIGSWVRVPFTESSSQPQNPKDKDIWYDGDYFYQYSATLSTWTSLAINYESDLEPASPSVGEYWFTPSETTLYYYYGYTESDVGNTWFCDEDSTYYCFVWSSNVGHFTAITKDNTKLEFILYAPDGTALANTGEIDIGLDELASAINTTIKENYTKLDDKKLDIYVVANTSFGAIKAKDLFNKYGVKPFVLVPYTGRETFNAGKAYLINFTSELEDGVPQVNFCVEVLGTGERYHNPTPIATDTTTWSILSLTNMLSVNYDASYCAGNAVADYFSTGAAYAVKDRVVYKGLLYQCIAPVTAGSAFNPNQWEQVKISNLLTGIIKITPVEIG